MTPNSKTFFAKLGYFFIILSYVLNFFKTIGDKCESWNDMPCALQCFSSSMLNFSFLFYSFQNNNFGRLASLVGNMERETGVGKLGWYGNSTGFDREKK